MAAIHTSNRSAEVPNPAAVEDIVLDTRVEGAAVIISLTFPAGAIPPVGTEINIVRYVMPAGTIDGELVRVSNGASVQAKGDDYDGAGLTGFAQGVTYEWGASWTEV